MRLRRWAGVFFAVVASLPTTARAQAQLRFEWLAPEACPSRERVLARAEELLGHAPESALRGNLELSARASQLADDAWQLDLGSHSDGGPPTARGVRATSCAELADAAALFLALAIDPELDVARRGSVAAFRAEPQPAQPSPAPAQPEPAGAAPVSAPTAAQPERPPSPSVTKSSTSAPPIVPRASLSVALWHRRLPDASVGALAQAGVSRGRGWALASFGYFPTRHVEVAKTSAGGDLSLVSGGLEVGYSLGPSAGLAEVSPLLAADLEWVRGSGTGVDHTTDANLALLGLGAGGRGSLRLNPRWRLVAEGVFSLLVARPRFVLDGVGEVYQPEPWGLRLSLGVEWRGR